MARTKINACNLALAHIGQSPIQSLEEQNTASRFCNRFYDAILEVVIADYNWSFNTKISDTLAEVDITVNEWAYAYSLPPDFLIPVKILETSVDTDGTTIYTTPDESTPIPFEIMGDYLYTNQQTPKIKYIFNNVNTAKQSSQFYMAFSYKLAAALAIPVAGKQGLSDSMEVRYERMIGKAKTTDSAADKVSLNDGQAYVDARTQNGSD